MRRRLNVRFLIALIGCFALAGGGVHLVHGFQERRNAGDLLERADRAEREGDRDEAEKNLGRYLAFRPGDEEARARHALSLAGRADDAKSRMQGLLMLERTLLHLPDRDDVRRRAAELALEPGIERARAAGDHLVYLLLRPGLGRAPSPEDRRRLEGLLLDYARRDADQDPSPPPALGALLASRDAGLELLLGRCFEALARSGRPEETMDRRRQALGCYKLALAHDPGRIDAYEPLAGLLRGPFKDGARADRAMDARELRDGLIAKNPGSFRAYLARAHYREANGIAGAAEDVARARQLAPGEPEVILAAASSAQRSGDLAAARALLEEGEASHPRDVRVLQARASLEAQSGDYEAALSALRRGLAITPDRPDLPFHIAGLLIQAGRPGEAGREIDRLRGRGDVQAAPLDYLEASLRIAEGRWREALRLLEEARSLAPVQSELAKQADLLLARGYERLGNPERALAASRRVLGQEPGSLPARAARASALVTMGRVDEALEDYRQIAPQDPAARVAVARLLLERNLRLPEGRRLWPEVDAALDEAERASPGEAEVAILRARALAARGQLDQARDRLRRARDERPQQVELWIALADLAGSQGRPEAILAALDEARRQLGDRIELALARVDYWGRHGGEGARRALAREALDLEKLPEADRVRLEDQLAVAYARVGDVGEAERLWERVASARPGDVRVATTLFDLALANDDEDKVRRGVARFKEIEGEDGVLWRFAEANRLILRARRGDATGLIAARGHLAELASRRPGWSRTSLLEARIAELEKDENRAIAAYLKAIDDGEKQPEVILRAVRLLGSRGREAEIDRLVQRLLDQGEAFGMVARLGAERAIRRKENDLALEWAKRAVFPDSKDFRDHIWLGQILWNIGRPGEAEPELRRAVAMDEARPEAWLALITFLARTDRKDAARAEVERARPKLPPDQAPLTMAAGYELIGDSVRAEEEYRAALAARPDDVAVLMASARFAQARGQNPKAEALLRQALAKSSGLQLIQAKRSLALCLIAQGGPARLQEALRILDRNLQEGGGVEDRRLRAITLAGQPYHSREAIDALEDLVRRQAATPAEKTLLAQLYLKGHDWVKARRVLLSGLASDGEAPPVLALLAECSLGQGQLDEAGPWVEKLDKVAPGVPKTEELRARLLEKQGRSDEAVAKLKSYARGRGGQASFAAALLEELGHPTESEAVLRESMARSPTPDADLKLAAFLGRQGRVRDALDLCERAWKACPAEAVGTTCVEILYASDAGDEPCQRVGRWLEEAMRKNPASLSLRFDLANLRTLQGRSGDAEIMLREILARDGNHFGALNNLAMALALERRGRGDEALSLINRAIAAGGTIPALLETRAAAYLGLGRGDLAIRELEAVFGEVTAGKQEVACGYFLLAQAHLMARNRGAATVALRKALAAGLTPAMIHPLERETYDRLMVDLNRGVKTAAPSRSL